MPAALGVRFRLAVLEGAGAVAIVAMGAVGLAALPLVPLLSLRLMGSTIHSAVVFFHTQKKII